MPYRTFTRRFYLKRLYSLEKHQPDYRVVEFVRESAEELGIFACKAVEDEECDEPDTKPDEVCQVAPHGTDAAFAQYERCECNQKQIPEKIGCLAQFFENSSFLETASTVFFSNR